MKEGMIDVALATATICIVPDAARTGACRAVAVQRGWLQLFLQRTDWLVKADVSRLQ